MDKLIEVLEVLKNSKQAEIFGKFFKTGPGDYGEGDQFWGINVPPIRQIARRFCDLPLPELEKLLQYPVHEVRFCALVIMTHQAKTQSQAMYELYMRNIDHINNWDLVDTSAEHIVGAYLQDKDKQILLDLAKSPKLWERRIAMISTFRFIKLGESDTAIKIVKILLQDNHDLIHKAVGWMLREIGSRCSIDTLKQFLDQHAETMPRMMLRYAIEKLSSEERLYYLGLGSSRQSSAVAP